MINEKHIMTVWAAIPIMAPILFVLDLLMIRPFIFIIEYYIPIISLEFHEYNKSKYCHKTSLGVCWEINGQNTIEM